MRTTLRRATILNLVIVAAMLALSAWAFGQLPAGTEIPIHWNAEGIVDDTSNKWFGLLVIPVGTVLLSGLLWVLPRLEPRRENLERSSFAYATVVVSVVVMMAVVHTIIVMAALGSSISVERVMPAGVGALFLVLGSVLDRVRSNYMMGIRTPWTLSSERSWEATHRAGKWMFMVFGAALIGLAAAGGGTNAFIALIVGLMLAAVGLTVYSYMVWRDDPDRG